jgi:hypothetical protein
LFVVAGSKAVPGLVENRGKMQVVMDSSDCHWLVSGGGYPVVGRFVWARK